MNDRKATRVTREMYNEMQREVEAKEEELCKISRLRGDCRPLVEGEEGTAEISAIEQQERVLRAEINSLKDTLEECEIIVAEEARAGVVGINSIVTVRLFEEDEEKPCEKRVSLRKANKGNGVIFITPESPLGNFILGKTVGSFGEYLVRGNRFSSADYKIGCMILAVE